MPVVSEAQRRFMYATAEGKTDAPRAVGREFIAASHGRTRLPEHVTTGRHEKKHPERDRVLSRVFHG